MDGKISNKDVIKQIIDAFDSVDRPGEITLFVAEAHDSQDYEHDAIHRKRDYFGSWQSLPEAHIEQCYNALCHVGKTSLPYYLPAYMLWHLRDFENRPTDCTYFVMDIDPAGSKSAYNHSLEKFSLFTPSQLSASALYLNFCATHIPNSSGASWAKRMLDNYWIKYA